MQLKSMSKFAPFLVPTLALLIRHLSFAAANEGEHAASCGDVHNISYPFWLRGEQPPRCGHPAFELICTDHHLFLANHSIEYPPHPKYAVKHIFPGNHSFWLVNMEFKNGKFEADDCPSDLILNGVHLDHALTIINQKLISYNCTSNTSNEDFAAFPTCFSNIFLAPDHDLPPHGLKECTMLTKIPILPDSAIKDEEDCRERLKEGFLAEWSEPDVGNWSKCTGSGGKCRNDGDFYCLCKDDQRHHENCNDAGTPPKSHKKQILTGVCAGIAGFVTAGLLFFLYLHCRKTKQISSSSTLLSRTTYSDSLDSHKDPEIGDEQYHTQIFMYEELEEATDGFSTSNELGDGGFGTVYKGKLRDGRTVAIKRFKNNYRRTDLFLNEVYILSSFRHSNLVGLYGCTSRHARELLLVYEYVPNGTVADHLHGPRAGEEALTWPLRLRIAIETAEALRYLHAVTPQLIHRDVKTNNILLDKSFGVKVADFGLSKLFPMNATHVSTAPQGTPGYVDPEYYQCHQLTDKSDVYSFGVVLAELISSKPAVDFDRQRDEINLGKMAILKIQNQELDELVDPKLWFQSSSATRTMIQQVAEVAFRCLQAERDMRPTIKEVLEALREIECEGDNVENGEEEGDAVNGEESLLSKRSPDTVEERWESKSTTPNSTG